MRILLVLAHPLRDSFAAAVAGEAKAALEANGHTADLLDLYAEDFDPRLSKSERGGYFDQPYDASSVAPMVERLKAADGLILVFPQWWFNFPAILKASSTGSSCLMLPSRTMPRAAGSCRSSAISSCYGR